MPLLFGHQPMIVVGLVMGVLEYSFFLRRLAVVWALRPWGFSYVVFVGMDFHKFVVGVERCSWLVETNYWSWLLVKSFRAVWFYWRMLG